MAIVLMCFSFIFLLRHGEFNKKAEGLPTSTRNFFTVSVFFKGHMNTFFHGCTILLVKFRLMHYYKIFKNRVLVCRSLSMFHARRRSVSSSTNFPAFRNPQESYGT